MPRRMQGDNGIFQTHALPIRDRLDPGRRPHPVPQKRSAGSRTQIMPRADAGVIRMRMRDHRTFHRPPRIDIKITRGTIKAFRADPDERIGVHCMHPITEEAASAESKPAHHSTTCF